MSAPATTTLQVQCHCKANSFTAEVPTSSLPLTASKCHCESCRHATGNLYLSDVPWPNPREDLSRLNLYDFSPRVKEYTCPTCFCRIFNKLPEEGRLTAFAGALNNLPGLLKFEEHIFVQDTIDGGASMWMRHSPDGAPSDRWTEFADHSHKLSFDWPGTAKGSGTSAGEAARPDIAPLWCHCRGVKLFVRSGTDLLSLPPDEIPWFVDKTTGKYETILDGCDSCVKTTGADTVYWTFAPITHISSTDSPSGDPEFRNKSDLLDAVKNKDPRLGTLTVYQSSKEAHRFYCSTCAAAIFFAGDSTPNELDIAIGVLDHPDGARAEGLCNWKLDKVEFGEDGQGGWRGDLYKSMIEQATEWQKSRA